MRFMTPNPDEVSEKHARRTGHSAQVVQVGDAKMARCQDCGLEWFNSSGIMEAIREDINQGFRIWGKDTQK